MYRCGLLRIEDVNKLEALCPSDLKWKDVLKRAISIVEGSDKEIYVVYKGSEIVGEVTVVYRCDETDERCIEGQRVYIEAFRVRKDLRNRGFGSTLLNYVIGTMYGRGFQEATLCVDNDNDIALHVYAKYGFDKVMKTYSGYKLLLRE